jgi:hypothetical protein
MVMASSASAVFGKSGESGFVQLGSCGWTVGNPRDSRALLGAHRREEFEKSLALGR